jgi:magnesium-transporting ATPase (P-type)
VISFFSAIILSFFYLFLVYVFSACILIVFILALFAGLIALAVYCFAKAKSVDNNGDHEKELLNIAGAIVCTVTFCLLCLICCQRKTIRISLAIIDAAVVFIKDTKRILFVPILFHFIGFLKNIAFWFAIACLASVGTVSTGGSQSLDYQT